MNLNQKSSTGKMIVFRLCSRIGLCRVRVQLHVLERHVHCHMNKVENSDGRSVAKCAKNLKKFQGDNYAHDFDTT